MKFSCEKALLQSAVSVVSRAVSSKSSIPALEGILLQTQPGKIILSGYNMQTGIRTRIEADTGDDEDEIVLNARLFGDIIRRMPDDVITLSSDKNLVVTLRCGDARFEIPALSAV